MRKTRAAVFSNVDDAQRAIDDLLRCGSNRDEISVLMSETTQKSWSAPKVTGPPIEGIDPDQSHHLQNDERVDNESYSSRSLPIAAVGIVAAPGHGLMGAGPAVAAIAATGSGHPFKGILGFLGASSDGKLNEKEIADRLRDGAVLVVVEVHANKAELKDVFHRNNGVLAHTG